MANGNIYFRKELWTILTQYGKFPRPGGVSERSDDDEEMYSIEGAVGEIYEALPR